MLRRMSRLTLRVSVAKPVARSPLKATAPRPNARNVSSVRHLRPHLPAVCGEPARHFASALRREGGGWAKALFSSAAASTAKGAGANGVKPPVPELVLSRAEQIEVRAER
jgi:hypothetical protein